MPTNVERLIDIVAGDLIAGTQDKPVVAINAEFHLVLLALLLHHNSRETLLDLIEEAK